MRCSSSPGAGASSTKAVREDDDRRNARKNEETRDEGHARHDPHHIAPLRPHDWSDVSQAPLLDTLDQNTRPYLSAISLWETAMLIERRRIEFTTPVARWLREVTAPQIVELVPVTVDVAAEVAALPGTFHRDPADRIIVATSRILGLPLITDDRQILTSRLVSYWRPTA